MQGGLVRYDPSPGFNPFELYQQRMLLQKQEETSVVEEEPPVAVRRGPGRPPGKGRKKGTVVNGFPILHCNPNLTLDMVLFGTPKEKEIDELFEPTGHTWCHSCCAVWSQGVEQEGSVVKFFDKTVLQAMSQVNCCSDYK